MGGRLQLPELGPVPMRGDKMRKEGTGYTSAGTALLRSGGTLRATAHPLPGDGSGAWESWPR
jgi:hypothetical protein